MDLSPSHLFALYQTGDITPVEVVDYVYSRLGDTDQEASWIHIVPRDDAVAAARTLDKAGRAAKSLPLYGLPFNVKDCIDVAGMPTTSACRPFSYTATETSPVVQKALDLGAICIGKTNLDQFATGLVGVRSDYGIPRNPHNPDYITGGSSSGTAVSVATGTTSFGFGTDTGGSGRVPASYCGIAGLKPVPGALSRRGMVYACRSIDTISIYTKTAADALTVYEPLIGYDPEDPFSLPGYLLDPAMEPAEAVCAVPANDQLEFFGNPETEKIFKDGAARAVRSFGAVTEIDYAPFLEINQLLFSGPMVAERYASVGRFLEENPDAGVPAVRQIILGAQDRTAADAYKGLYRIAEVRRYLETAFWPTYDALMVPTVGTLVTLTEIERDPITPNFNNGYYTNFANPLGLAAVAVPNGVASSGVPCGVTFVGPPGSEGKLVSMATAFQAA